MNKEVVAFLLDGGCDLHSTNQYVVILIIIIYLFIYLFMYLFMYFILQELFLCRYGI